jgi:hypothetical protein
MTLNSDFRDLLCEFNAAEVRYLVVGAYAVFLHAQPRYTRGLDVWVDATPENAPRVFAALTKFGAEVSQLTAADFAGAGVTFQMGLEPSRVDVLTELSAVTFDEAWPARVESTYGDQRICVLGRELLLKNKRALGRPQDLLDVEKLERANGL